MPLQASLAYRSHPPLPLPLPFDQWFGTHRRAAGQRPCSHSLHVTTALKSAV